MLNLAEPFPNFIITTENIEIFVQQFSCSCDKAMNVLASNVVSLLLFRTHLFMETENNGVKSYATVHFSLFLSNSKPTAELSSHPHKRLFNTKQPGSMVFIITALDHFSTAPSL